jgi:nitroreductase
MPSPEKHIKHGGSHDHAHGKPGEDEGHAGHGPALGAAMYDEVGKSTSHHAAHGHGSHYIDPQQGKHMDVFEAIYTRRSIRKFLGTPVEFDKLIEVIRAGAYAPCAGNLQNWKFILESNPDKVRSMYHHTLEQEAFLTATAAVIVVAETEIAEKFYGMRGKRLYAVQNCAAAIQNMLLAAHALGLGGVWIGAFDENRINDMYRIPSSARAQGIVLLGYPDEKPSERHMKNIWFLVNFNRYGLKYHRAHLITHDISVEWARKGDDYKRGTDRFTKKLQEKTGFSKASDLKAKAAESTKDFFKDTREHAQKLLKSLKKSPPK